GPMAAEVPAWAAKQTYLAMGTFMMVAAMLGIDTCPIEGISTEQYDHILGLSETDYQTVAVLAAGYRASDDVAQTERKVRFPRHEVIAYL
ncbi:MAG: nitroreductase family protein, partial [Candidatus Margulisiibacteriota bacterium]